MAKRNENGSPKSKITVMMFQMEGTDETLLEGIRTIGNAIGHVMKPSRQLAKPANALANGEAEAVDGENGNGSTDIPAEVEDEQTTDAPSSSSPGAKVRQPIIVNNLDINSVTSPTLKEFLDQKKADGDSDKYLVISYWLKEYMKVPEVTMDHIYTCYRFFGWNTPTDASSPLRSGKKAGFFNKAASKGAYSINLVGENKVKGMGKEA